MSTHGRLAQRIFWQTINSYFFFEFDLDLPVDLGFFSTSWYHSSLSAVSKPPNPTTIKINGHKSQKVLGNKPTFEAKKISPMIIIAIGQKYFLGIHVLRYLCTTYKPRGTV